ncbi:aldehyde dehydrogenase family protein [Steroidobacter cummioxidans]|uniref:aldehyde dehydrogenase family protein n=1 Tax=Steroidobacter cummioxidans TaxID=1803913 RepID=UPI0019D4E806|nr:aldehyde dehydrogenase family protein [Steroidobacter cummioxidans]
MNRGAKTTDNIMGPFVDGLPLISASEGIVEVVNPSNGQHCLTIPAGCEEDVNRAVASARRVFDAGAWADATPMTRKRVLHRFADLIAAEAVRLDALDAAEMGKPVRERFASASVAADLMRFHAEAIDKVMGDVYGTDKNSFVTQRRVARGVVAAIVPWNFPVYSAAVKIAPAIAAGNSVVLKPSEQSSRSAMRLAQLALEAGLPPGVMNVVPGLGETVGKALGLHMDVDVVAFTGSSVVGKRLLEYAGQSNMKLVLAECGGKSPQIVFDDGVDLDTASESIARLLLTNQGQICTVGSRLLVQRSIEGEVLEKLTTIFQQIVMGDALDPSTTFGPVASARQCKQIMRYVETAAAEGARLVVGGRAVLQETGGYFVEPTIFRNVSPRARIAQEEIFGPVLSVTTFEDDAEVIRIANSTMYGLMAYVWTTDITTAMRMAKGIRSSVLINADAPTGEGGGHACSFEPAGQSGVGTEGGLAGLESYLRRQLVCINHS